MMSNFLAVLLAVYGVSHILVWEDGPWDVLSKIRYWFGVRYAEGGARYGVGGLGNLLNCQICTSVWITFPIAWLCSLHSIVAYGLAAVGFVCMVMDLVD
jgi:hypothetical protein